MAKKSKLARCSSGTDEDRLSSLPDEILIDILSLMPMRDTQRTSIFGRRWRYLWSYVPGLDLDGSEKVMPLPPVTRQAGFIHYERLDEVKEPASKYAEWVDRVIDAYRGTAALRHFRVIFRLAYSLAGKIDSWLEFSLRKGVEVLELDCCWRDSIRNPPYGILHWIEPSRFPNIRLLKSLTLRAVTISSNSLERLLSACESLERLELAGLRGVAHVNVTGPVSRLKHIHIDSCGCHLESIKIHAPTPDLVSLRFPPDVLTTVHIEHAPRLVDLRMVLPASGAYQHITLHPLFRYLSQLEALDLAVFGVRGVYAKRVHDFPVLGRLKHLKWTKVYCEIKGSEEHWVATLIKKAPLLQHLTLQFRRESQERFAYVRAMELRGKLDKMHLQLPPVIEISGFRGRKLELKLVLHLIEESPSLEKLILDCRDPERRGCTFAPYEFSAKTVKKCKGLIKKFIKPKLPSKAKLVVI